MSCLNLIDPLALLEAFVVWSGIIIAPFAGLVIIGEVSGLTFRKRSHSETVKYQIDIGLHYGKRYYDTWP